ncbi:unnamed protein product [Phytophthora fragariaefolia]|uniref:Unnamed protein product n=1 Tax=Phytophthora fragariaefolia TaxID=1490495 RepID=A0A9W6X8J0_9STRA|nr:unnamed protein product [Phytophthora fragariaefolia]
MWLWPQVETGIDAKTTGGSLDLFQERPDRQLPRTHISNCDKVPTLCGRLMIYESLSFDEKDRRAAGTVGQGVPVTRWLGWKYRIRSHTETLLCSEYETPGVYPSSTVTARDLNQATARKLKQRRSWLNLARVTPDTVPAVSPTTAPPLAPSVAKTTGPNSPPSSGQPGGQASSLLTPPSAPRAGAESASTRSPTPVTAESPTEPEDSAVGSTSPPLSSVSSAPTQPTSVSLGLRSGADDLLSSPSEVARSDIYSPLPTPSPNPPRASVPPGFRPDGLLEAGVPPLPEPSPVQAKPAASSPVRRSASPPSTSLYVPSSASPAGSHPNSIAELWDFHRRWEAEREAEDRTRTQLTAYALMRPALLTDFALRRGLLRAQSFGDMLDVLRANTAEPPSSTKEHAELRVQNAKLTRDNQALLRRLESALASSIRFEHDLATVVRERDEWKRHATKTSELVASFRNTVCVLEPQRRESTRQANCRVDSCQQLVDQRDKDLKRMSEVLAERDVAYSALQGVASSYFEQVQEAAVVISAGGADRALRFASPTIDNQRRIIQRQKNVLRHNGRISVTDPALALAAATGIDAPGLSPGDLALNARLCRHLETRWPELSQVQPSQVREITLRVSGPVAPSSAPVSLPLSSAAPTSDSSAAGLAMTPADFHVPSAEPRRVPGSPFRRGHLAPVTRPSVHVSSSSSVPRSGSAASAAPAASSAGLVSSTVVTSAPESTARPLPAVSAGLVSSTPPPTRRTSPQATKASAGATSKSARKSPTKAAAGSSRREPRNSAASPKSTSTVAPAPSITGSTRSQRASAMNARAINNLELQALEASDAEVLGWSSGAANSAAHATSAPSPLRQSSSDDSADDEVVLQRSRRLRRKSVVESDESSDSVAEALEEKPASPLTSASVSPTPSTGQKRPSSPVAPASTKTARASASAKSSSPPRPVAKSTSRVRPTAKSRKAAKSATKTARGTAKSGKSAKSADPPTPDSGQSASASGTAAVSAPTSSASSGQASNSAGGAQLHSPMCCASLS